MIYNGYYAQGVDFTTAILPKGWKSRLIELFNANTGGVTGLCLEVHDLVISKFIAGREKDLDFIKAAIKHGIVNRETLEERLELCSVDEKIHNIILTRITAFFTNE